MDLKILYDNKAKSGFRRGWGFSAFLHFEDEKILFDTGWDGRILLSNMENFDIMPDDIDKIVLSHSHWDHIGGLTHLERAKKGIYVPRSFSEHLKKEISERFFLHEVEGPQKIGKKIWTTGEIENSIEEQSLILESKKGLIVVVGCSHPGVGKIFEKASEFGSIYGIVGGLHDFKQYKILDDLGLIVATHCTKNEAKISELFPDAYFEGVAGSEISI